MMRNSKAVGTENEGGLQLKVMRQEEFEPFQ